MKKEEKKTEKAGNKLGKFQKGYDPRRNTEGKTKGTLNFSTKWIKFIEKVAEQEGKTIDEVDEQMLKVAYKQIIRGDHRYWKDITDRVYGQSSQNINLVGKIAIDEETKQKTKEAIKEVVNRTDTGRRG
ncbi:MAG: hypothetical protein PF549_02705 [Patescibacteria group bacterium]|jgi:hypothetical protein|nr:hypothetical protein [Patescibacteria group bacterium]